MNKQHSSGSSSYRETFGRDPMNGRTADSAPSSGIHRSREEYLDRVNKPGQIDRPFTRRMQREAQKTVKEPAPEVKKEQPKHTKKEHTRSQVKSGLWKYILGGAAAALLLAFLFVMIFGEHGTHHAMPKITPPEALEETIGG